VPVHCNILWSTRREAIHAPKGDLQLGFCQRCGHILNLAFDPELITYTQTYENSLHFSPRFQSYAESLANRLIKQYELYGKDIIEIGCGQGDFLKLLCQLGGNRGVGFDPSYVPELDEILAENHITIIRDFYSERFAHYEADLICSRHVLEHIQFPQSFLASVRRSIGDRSHTLVFFEVPNVLFTLQDMGIWDLIYEHCSYFSRNSLSYLLNTQGFEVINQTEVFEGQYLCIESLPRKGHHSFIVENDGNLERLKSHVTTFADNYRERVAVWQKKFEQFADAGHRVVIWGGGSKGVTFLNTLGFQEQVEYVVDINPRKHGKYVAGTGQQIVPPEHLQNYQPEVVIVMNPIYYNEIQQNLLRLGITPQLLQI
jgi:2-polyprenyl-3-methyl-5-hydroxy-6-metoxy-1,4-benzoquinol methylase